MPVRDSWRLEIASSKLQLKGSNSPFDLQTRKIGRLIKQFIRSHLGLYSRHPFNLQLNLPLATSQNAKPKWSLTGGGSLGEDKNLIS